MILPGIYASQISGHLFTPTGRYTSIATATVDSGGANTVTFSSIPSTYTHLQIRYILKTTGLNGGSPRVWFNGDNAGSNYAFHELYGDGSTAGATNVTANTFGYLGLGMQTTSQFTAGVLDILDYSSTNKNKTMRLLTGYDANGSGTLVFASNLWMNSSTAINSITFQPQQTADFAQYSQFALYGVK